MKRSPLIIILIGSILLASCSQAPRETSTPSIPSDTPQPAIFLLAEPGPYPVGIRRGTSFEDASRNNRKVAVTIWYPATLPEDPTETEPYLLAVPDSSGAPYPVVLSSAKAGGVFGTHLASYGFVVVGISGQDSAEHWGPWLTDYPRDLVFALDQISINPPEELAELMDTEHAGAMGYSFDGYTSLALSGARIDPEFYLAQCASAPLNTAVPAWWIDYICNMTGGWDAFVANAGLSITESADELWQPITDPRIRAVMPMAPEGAWLFGERGLAAADRPTLIIGATIDGLNIYALEAVYIFEHLEMSDKIMISFIDEGHMMIFDAKPIARMKHFATAFFSYHLKADKAFEEYFSEEFLAQFDDLAWGVYVDE